jgi:hypothetical protein
MNAPRPDVSSPPQGLSVSRGRSPDAFALTRRWARPKHALLVAIAGGAAAYLVPRWIDVAEGAAEVTSTLVLGSVFAFGFTFNALSALVRRTTIAVDSRHVHVNHGALPSLTFPRTAVARDGVVDFEARPWGPRYEVVSVDAEGTRTRLVRPLITSEQAEYVRDALRNAWALPAGEVLPEVEDAAQAAVRAGGSGGLAALPILLIALLLAVFFFMTSTDVEGSATIGEGAEAVRFIPTDCRSGVPRGFFGVELTGDALPGTVVRVVRDPVRGSMVALERGGGTPRVFGPDACTTLNLNVEQTSTNVNDVWVLRGSARAACEGLEMDVRFDGCH